MINIWADLGGLVFFGSCSAEVLLNFRLSRREAITAKASGGSRREGEGFEFKTPSYGLSLACVVVCFLFSGI